MGEARRRRGPALTAEPGAVFSGLCLTCKRCGRYEGWDILLATPAARSPSPCNNCGAEEVTAPTLFIGCPDCKILHCRPCAETAPPASEKS